MFEVGKDYKVVTLEDDIEGPPIEVQRFNCKVLEIQLLIVRFGWVTGDHSIINVSSPRFVCAEHYD